MFSKGISVATIARTCNVSERSVRDWRREKYQIDENAVRFLKKQHRVQPGAYQTLKEGWHLSQFASLGGRMRIQQYGAPGTPEGRKKGGMASQARRREDPEYYRLLGCNVRKSFVTLTPSEELAEIFGILLGDGGLTDYQVIVSLDAKADKGYDTFTINLFSKVFDVEPSVHIRKSVCKITISGASLVEALEQLGLRRGNKVAHQVAIPDWIMQNPVYQRAVLRGLFDTDGGIYTHRKPRGSYLGWCFANCSKPIIAGVSRILDENGFKHSIQYEKQVYMYRLSDILRYMSVVGSHNPKNAQRIRAVQDK